MAYSSINRDVENHMGRPKSANPATRAGRRHGKDIGIVGQASWISSVINLVNTIVGAGVLAMPQAMSHMGIVLGVLVIVWSGITSGLGLYLQTRCARYLDRGSASFFAFSQMTYPAAAFFFDAAIAIKCFGVGVSYLIIIGDLMPGVVQAFGKEHGALPFLLDRHFWITAFMLIIIPISFLRRLDSLKYTSFIALVSIAYLVILVLAHFIKGDTDRGNGELRVIHWGGAIPALSSFPVIVFAYTCHQNMFSILNEINNNSYFRTTGVVLASNGLACFLYILVAITGYLSFGNLVGSNIIAEYAPAVASTIGKAAIVIMVMFSYPLQLHPCRASVDAVLKWRPGRRADSPNSSPSRGGSAPLLSSKKNPKAEPMNDTRFAVITTTILILSYIVAMTVSSLAVVLGYVGSTGSTTISFILPGLLYYKISSPDSPHHQKLVKEDDEVDDDSAEDHLLGGGRAEAVGWRKGLLRKLSIVLAVYGVCVMITCLVTNAFFHATH